MSRGVSYATGSVWKFYLYPQKDGKTEDEFGTFDWDEFIDNLKTVLKGWGRKGLRSLNDCNKWLGWEDHAILENGHAYIGVSEYCGTVCLWCVPKDQDGYRPDTTSIREHWCAQVEGTVRKILLKAFPDSLMESLGHASNGEQFFRPVNRPAGLITTKEGQLW